MPRPKFNGFATIADKDVYKIDWWKVIGISEFRTRHSIYDIIKCIFAGRVGRKMTLDRASKEYDIPISTISRWERKINRDALINIVHRELRNFKRRTGVGRGKGRHYKKLGRGII